jgi:phosphoribosyl 1,2-cyclic phosphodiesterase
MKVRFWGVRGSIPTPDLNKMKVGGNTSCVEVKLDNQRIIFDMGTGVRALGHSIANEMAQGLVKNIFIILSHTHWDHIQGLPFFAPLFMNINLTIFGPAKANRKLEDLLSAQMEYDYWPVKFSHLPAKINFQELSEGFYKINDSIQIWTKRHIHPGMAFGYRLDCNGKSLTYSTDTEHFQNVLDKRVIELCEGTDLLIHDAQYTEKEIGSRLGWGHSTWNQAIQVAQAAKAKRVALFHMDPERTDEEAFSIQESARKILPTSFLALEGNEVEL